MSSVCRAVIVAFVFLSALSPFSAGPDQCFMGSDPWNRLPDAFDWRDKDGHFWMTPIRDQAGCDLLFTYAVVGALEAGIKIQANNPWLMPDFCEQDSIPEWRIGNCGWTSSDVDSIKRAILTGPVVGRLIIYDDLFAYPGGIYEHQWGDWQGEHYVVLLGWSDADSCWICKNSWGPHWGEDGWFRIGYGQCEIEDNGAYWLIPIGWARDGVWIPETSFQFELQPGATTLDTLVIINTFLCDSVSFAFEITSKPLWVAPATLGDTLNGGDTLGVEFNVNTVGLEGFYVDTLMVEITDAQGEEPELRPVRVELDVNSTHRNADGEEFILPGKHVLWQNYPNPFNARTTIRYQITSATHVTLRVYNLWGQAVNTLVDEDQTAGDYFIEWNTPALSSGMYVYTLSAGDCWETRKMVLLK